MYCKFTAIDGVEYIRGPQGQFPMSEDNRDYRTYLEWVAEGNEPQPWNPDAPPAKP